MELAALIGISISEFWEITPFELSIAFKGYQKREEMRRKEYIQQAYLISRWVWQKKVDIEKILDTKKKNNEMTDEQMLERVKVLNAIFGGEVRTVG